MPDADHLDVVKKIRRWLQDNLFASLLYVGAHGVKGKNAGLVPRATRNRTRIGYQELAQEIQNNLSPNARSLSICLAACNSAEALSAFGSLPIHLLIVFNGEPTSKEVRNLILRVLHHQGLRSQDDFDTDKPISDLVDDVVELSERFPEAEVITKWPHART